MTGTNPRIVSLWDLMQKLNGRDFALHLQAVTSFAQMLTSTSEPGKSHCLPEQARDLLRSHVDELHDLCVSLDLDAAAASLERVQELMDRMVDVPGNPGFRGVDILHLPAFTGAFNEVGGRIHDGLRGRVLLSLTRNEAKLFEPDGPLFGEAVEDKFGQTRGDIEEAAKCFALGRYTASVFHLMRAAESAAGTLAGAIGASVVDKNGEPLSLGVIVANMEPKIKAMPTAQARDKWLKVHALLHSCNRAYRTKTAHPVDKYTETEADTALRATRSFMQEFAALL